MNKEKIVLLFDDMSDEREATKMFLEEIDFFVIEYSELEELYQDIINGIHFDILVLDRTEYDSPVGNMEIDVSKTILLAKQKNPKCYCAIFSSFTGSPNRYSSPYINLVLSKPDIRGLMKKLQNISW